MQDRRVIPLFSLEEPETLIYAQSRESQLAHFYEPEPGLFIAESCLVAERALAAGYRPESFLIHTRKLADVRVQALLSRCPDVKVFLAERSVLEQLTGYHLTGGVLCAMRRKAPLSAEALLPSCRRVAVLEDVTNPTNVGAIFRSAAALGMDAVLLCPGCSDPLYRRSIRVSMGTVFQIPWRWMPENEANIPGLLDQYGFKTVAMALGPSSVPLSHLNFGKDDRIAVFLGNEGYGLRDETVKSCTSAALIPMKNGVDSLNVAAASAVAFWELY